MSLSTAGYVHIGGYKLWRLVVHDTNIMDHGLSRHPDYTYYREMGKLQTPPNLSPQEVSLVSEHQETRISP